MDAFFFFFFVFMESFIQGMGNVLENSFALFSSCIMQQNMIEMERDRISKMSGFLFLPNSLLSCVPFLILILPGGCLLKPVPTSPMDTQLLKPESLIFILSEAILLIIPYKVAGLTLLRSGSLWLWVLDPRALSTPGDVKPQKIWSFAWKS